MGVVVIGAWRRWPRLDWGQRWVASGIAVFFTLYLVATPMAVMHRKTRLVQELPILLGTLALLQGFATWQPNVSYRRALRLIQVGFVLLWSWAQVLQGLRNDFSTISGPIHAAVIATAAGLTLIAQAQFGSDRWTDQGWFWISVGLMVVYGTEVLLDPLLDRIFRVRDDLANLAFGFHQVLSVAGYLLVLRGVLGPGKIRAKKRLLS